MRIHHSKYRINNSKQNKIEITPLQEYIPLVQLLLWMNSFKTSDDIEVNFFQTYSSRAENFPNKETLLELFKTQTEAQGYLQYPFHADANYSLPFSRILSRIDSFPVVCTQYRNSEKYISGWGVFGLLDGIKNFHCLYCITVHKDNILQVINCVLENKEIDNSLLEVWYNAKIRVRGSDYFKKIRLKVHTFIKTLENQGIKSISMPEIPFFKIIKLPVFKNLQEKEEFIRSIYKKMLSL